MGTVVAIILANFVASNLAEDNHLVFTNYCDTPIWVGISAKQDGGAQAVYPNIVYWDNTTNPKLEIGETRTVNLTEEVYSISAWGRTNCDFTHQGDSDYVCCATGDCECRKVCTTGIDYGGTQAEINFGAGTIPDNYDISNIVGFHIPTTIKPISPYTDASGTDLSCLTGGEPYETMSDWFDTLISDCNSYRAGENLVYSVANWDGTKYKCDLEGTDAIQTVRLCIKQFILESRNVSTDTLSATKYESYCLSDYILSSYVSVIGDQRPSSWPGYSDTEFDKYDCPGDAYSGPCDCPSNYHCLKDGDSLPSCSTFATDSACSEPYPGEPPYTNWSRWMYDQGLNDKTYLFAYDDDVSLMTCHTAEGSRSYSITFCPANAGMFTTSVPDTTQPTEPDSANDYSALFALLLPVIWGYFV